MQVEITYEKSKVLQALRYHFITRPDIKAMAIVIVLFSLVSGIFLALKKIKPQLFLLASVLWIGFFIIVFYLLPHIIYSKSKSVFQDTFTASLQPGYLSLQNARGRTEWPWSRFNNFVESDHFFFLYFNKRSFFLLPKNQVDRESLQAMREIIAARITKE